MFTGGEDCSAKIWDLKMRNLSCQRIFQANSSVNCVCLHPNQQELIIGDQSGTIHIWNLQNDQSEQLTIPEKDISIQSLSIDPQGLYLAAINNKVNIHFLPIIVYNCHFTGQLLCLGIVRGWTKTIVTITSKEPNTRP